MYVFPSEPYALKTADPGQCCQTLPSSVPCRLFPFRAPSRCSASRRYACTPGNPDVVVACRRCSCAFTVCVSVRPIGPAPTSHVIPVSSVQPRLLGGYTHGNRLCRARLVAVTLAANLVCHVFCEWLTDCWWLSRISWRWERRKYFSTKFTISVRKSEGKEDGLWNTKFAGISVDMMMPTVVQCYRVRDKTWLCVTSKYQIVPNKIHVSHKQHTRRPFMLFIKLTRFTVAIIATRNLQEYQRSLPVTFYHLEHELFVLLLFFYFEVLPIKN